jgi:uncharacterized protein
MCDDQCWYKNGLRFTCTGCGRCCSGAPGYVWVTSEEISAMAQHLSLSPELFVQRYIRQVGDRLALIELPNRNYDCIFLKNQKCMIYDYRPRQCRTFPWWKENLTSPESWEEAALYCEGIAPEGELVPSKTIQAIVDGTSNTPSHC